MNEKRKVIISSICLALNNSYIVMLMATVNDTKRNSDLRRVGGWEKKYTCKVEGQGN